MTAQVVEPANAVTALASASRAICSALTVSSASRSNPFWISAGASARLAAIEFLNSASGRLVFLQCALKISVGRRGPFSKVPHDAPGSQRRKVKESLDDKPRARKAISQNGVRVSAVQKPFPNRVPHQPEDN